MQANCGYCGSPLAPHAQRCGRCGQPIVALGPAAPAVGRRLPLIPLIVGTAVAGLCLCAVIAAGVWMWRSNQLPGPVIPGVTTTTPTTADATEVEVDEATRQRLEVSVARLEAAFRAKDLETVKSLTHPAVQATYQPIFEAHRDELGRVADLLATRRLVAATDYLAEYEVTENGRIYTVTFEPWGETWYLSSL